MPGRTDSCTPRAFMEDDAAEKNSISSGESDDEAIPKLEDAKTAAQAAPGTRPAERSDAGMASAGRPTAGRPPAERPAAGPNSAGEPAAGSDAPHQSFAARPASAAAPVRRPLGPLPIGTEEEEVAELLRLDDEFLAVWRRFEERKQALRDQCTALQAPILERRRQLLAQPRRATATGTPGLPSFWLQTLMSNTDTANLIEDHDEPVLEYLADVRVLPLEVPSPSPSMEAFELVFDFAENPYFENKSLSKKYFAKEMSPYCTTLGAIGVDKIEATKITWKKGKDVTVAAKQKKKKGAKGAKASPKIPRSSFFRGFFATLEMGKPPPRGLCMRDGGESSDDDDVDEQKATFKTMCLMEQDFEVGSVLKDQIVPYAVRWFTGEACEGDDQEEEEEEEEDEEDLDPLEDAHLHEEEGPFEENI